MAPFLSTLISACFLASGFAGVPLQLSVVENEPSSVVVIAEDGDELYATPEQCLSWKTSNPTLYKKYCT